jgi:hypothetical protein
MAGSKVGQAMRSRRFCPTSLAAAAGRRKANRLICSSLPTTIRHMLIAVLILVNIPVFLLIGWVVFDDKETAAESFLAGLLHLLKVLFLPRIVRLFMGDDTDEGLSLLQVGFYFLACIAAVVAEYHALLAIFPTLGGSPNPAP